MPEQGSYAILLLHEKQAQPQKSSKLIIRLVLEGCTEETEFGLCCAAESSCQEFKWLYVNRAFGEKVVTLQQRCMG